MVHLRTTKDGVFDIDALEKRVARRKPKLVDASKLKVNRSRVAGFSPKSRYPNVDMGKPIILDEDGNIIDGQHRVARHQDEGRKKLKAIVASKKDIAAVRRVMSLDAPGPLMQLLESTVGSDLFVEEEVPPICVGCWIPATELFGDEQVCFDCATEEDGVYRVS